MAFKRPYHPCLESPSLVQAILLDAGGVLLDDNVPWLSWQRRLVRVMGEQGVPVTLRDVRVIARKAAESFAPSISWATAQHFGYTKELLRASWKGLSIGEPVAGAREVLLRLRGRAPLALVANQARDARGILRQHGLEELFDVIVLSEELGISKPCSQIFLHAMRALQVLPTRSVMIGDRIDTDIVPARRLGMLAIRVKRGPYCWQQPTDQISAPHLTLRSLEAVSYRLGSP